MVKEYLKKLQALQLELLGTNIALLIQNRMPFASDSPWLAVSVYPDGQQKSTDGKFICHNTTLSYYDFQTEEENRNRLEKEYNEIIEFINTHKK